eukprot:TRINITY_DN10840_c0_g1_i10.p1 TRINITY_DN10840_c0_g1~~TRINITY_DN10840_c0_g1_i10.p1  ORF type:complete len:734 (-),score=58.92 TRINITY_DN10840_c0_g1_i10:189-2156(-)
MRDECFLNGRVKEDTQLPGDSTCKANGWRLIRSSLLRCTCGDAVAHGMACRAWQCHEGHEPDRSGDEDAGWLVSPMTERSVCLAQDTQDLESFTTSASSSFGGAYAIGTRCGAWHSELIGPNRAEIRECVAHCDPAANVNGTTGCNQIWVCTSYGAPVLREFRWGVGHWLERLGFALLHSVWIWPCFCIYLVAVDNAFDEDSNCCSRFAIVMGTSCCSFGLAYCFIFLRWMREWSPYRRNDWRAPFYPFIGMIVVFVVPVVLNLALKRVKFGKVQSGGDFYASAFGLFVLLNWFYVLGLAGVWFWIAVFGICLCAEWSTDESGGVKRSISGSLMRSTSSGWSSAWELHNARLLFVDGAGAGIWVTWSDESTGACYVSVQGKRPDLYDGDVVMPKVVRVAIAKNADDGEVRGLVLEWSTGVRKGKFLSAALEEVELTDANIQYHGGNWMLLDDEDYIVRLRGNPSRSGVLIADLELELRSGTLLVQDSVQPDDYKIDSDAESASITEDVTDRLNRLATKQIVDFTFSGNSLQDMVTRAPGSLVNYPRPKCIQCEKAMVYRKTANYDCDWKCRDDNHVALPSRDKDNWRFTCKECQNMSVCLDCVQRTLALDPSRQAPPGDPQGASGDDVVIGAPIDTLDENNSNDHYEDVPNPAFR